LAVLGRVTQSQLHGIGVQEEDSLAPPIFFNLNRKERERDSVTKGMSHEWRTDLNDERMHSVERRVKGRSSNICGPQRVGRVRDQSLGLSRRFPKTKGLGNTIRRLQHELQVLVLEDHLGREVEDEV
jgi:hypothetical protein